VSFNDVVKCICYFADMTDFDRFNAAYRECFSGILPARATVASALKGIKVEIDANRAQG
jgi:enamine deaminase RidA (YjgF/YER057c/UK114 family)